ncbi:MAG: hypothetical protein PHV68_03985, partial [Candidatus Gastranaerophilales bacterium]|nr:hypothetical protein [Candidatus Gastranaerophilales bacterium]
SAVPSLGGSGSGVSAEGCWHSGDNSWYFLNGTGRVSLSSVPGLILNNGSLVFFQIEKSDCSKDLSAYGASYTRCGYIDIDINGFKKPNTIGKDIFEVSIAENALVPAGAQGFFDPSTTCIEGSTDSDNKGYGCAAKYLYE